jgi:hypothetical protein
MPGQQVFSSGNDQGFSSSNDNERQSVPAAPQPVPGSQRAGLPRMRWYRVMMSCGMVPQATQG